jgi:hypothetical protein
MKKEPLLNEIDCCPSLEVKPVCDVLDLRYSLPSRVTVKNQDVPMQIIFHFRLERCSLGLAMGDLAYTTTLLPGEQVRLFSSDRHTSWSYDSASAQSWRSQTTSEESFLTWGIAAAVSDLTISESGHESFASSESWAQGGGGLGINLFGLISIGGGGSGGSYDASATYDFSRSLSRHASAVAAQAAAGVRASSCTQIGEVQQRTHAQGESDERIESSSRVFSNPNKCHAVTYLFYKLMKLQKIKFTLVAIERVVNDPMAPSLVDKRPATDSAGMVKVRPQEILANQTNRLDIERMARTSAQERQREFKATATMSSAQVLYKAGVAQTITPELRAAAMAQAAKNLAVAGLVDEKTGRVKETVIAELSWERDELLPTPGFIVKGCLDDCCTCEKELQKSIELDLQRKELENDLLQRQIDLLEKSQEYRCCPAGQVENSG